MKIYTLDFDCNQPTAQQVNVPTNTDYKLGIKVRRNGELQSLSPESVTLGGLSADAQKTNGYVTFTLSSDDSASYTQATLSIDTTDYIAISAENTNTSRATKCTVLSAQLEPYADRTLYGTNVRIEYKPNVDADFEDINYDAMNGGTAVMIYDKTEQFNKYVWFGNAVFSDTGAANKRFLKYADASTIAGWVDSIKLEGISQIGFTWTGRNHPQVFPKFQFNESAANPLVVRITLTTGDIPLVANFKLNTNIFKSQQGDIADGVEDASTAKLTGQFADGTDFDYNLVIV